MKGRQCWIDTLEVPKVPSIIKQSLIPRGGNREVVPNEEELDNSLLDYTEVGLLQLLLLITSFKLFYLCTYMREIYKFLKFSFVCHNRYFANHLSFFKGALVYKWLTLSFSFLVPELLLLLNHILWVSTWPCSFQEVKCKTIYIFVYATVLKFSCMKKLIISFPHPHKMRRFFILSTKEEMRGEFERG